MKLVVLACIFCLFSCKKVDTNVDNIVVLQVTIKNYRPTYNSNLLWGIDLSFYPKVTTSGSVNVEYDIYSSNTLLKHYSYKVPFTLSNQETFVYNTLDSAQTTATDIKNIKVSGLIMDGGYQPTLMTPKGVISGSSSSSGCGSYNGHQLYLGPNGGCYYYNGSGNKSYIDRGYCHC